MNFLSVAQALLPLESYAPIETPVSIVYNTLEVPTLVVPAVSGVKIPVVEMPVIVEVPTHQVSVQSAQSLAQPQCIPLLEVTVGPERQGDRPLEFTAQLQHLVVPGRVIHQPVLVMAQPDGVTEKPAPGPKAARSCLKMSKRAAPPVKRTAEKDVEGMKEKSPEVPAVEAAKTATVSRPEVVEDVACTHRAHGEVITSGRSKIFHSSDQVAPLEITDFSKSSRVNVVKHVVVAEDNELKGLPPTAIEGAIEVEALEQVKIEVPTMKESNLEIPQLLRPMLHSEPKPCTPVVVDC